MRTQQHTNGTKTAIGYVRVSTQEQATEGVSLDAQRDRLRTYCELHSIKLIDMKSDEGYSGSTLDRPALQAALDMLRRGRANTLLVAKLDRLSGSSRDVCSVVDEMFSDERYHLHEEEVLRQVASMRERGLKLRELARRLNEAKIPARRDGIWRATRVSIVLQRSGKQTVKPDKSPGPPVRPTPGRDRPVSKLPCRPHDIDLTAGTSPSYSDRLG